MSNKYPALAWYRLWRIERRELIHFGVASTALVLGIFSHFTEHSAWWTLAAVALVVVTETILLWREYLALAEPGDKKLVVVNVFDELKPELAVAKFPPSYEYAEPIEGGAVVRSEAFDRWIIKEQPDIPLHIRKAGFEEGILSDTDPYLHEAFDYLVARLHSTVGKHFYNESKVSLRTELKEGVKSVIVGKTSYIASSLTNDACTNRLVRQGRIYADLTVLYPKVQKGERTELLGLADSRLSNHLGASTIALFQQEDGVCMVSLPIQGNSAARSSGKLAPTGSGSLDWLDVRMSPKKDLLSIVARGATRELCEEQGLIPLGNGGKKLDYVINKHSVRTMVMGYYRWLNYGALPQFCCISTIRVESIYDLKPDKRELAAHDSSSGLTQVRRSISSINELGLFCEDMLRDRTHLSLPLAVNLDLIHKALTRKLGDECYASVINFIRRQIPEIDE